MEQEADAMKVKQVTAKLLYGDHGRVCQGCGRIYKEANASVHANHCIFCTTTEINARLKIESYDIIKEAYQRLEQAECGNHEGSETPDVDPQ